MRVVSVYDHCGGVGAFAESDRYEWLCDVFDSISLNAADKSAPSVREHVKNEFARAGWALGVKIDTDHNLTVFATIDDLAFQLQTGNVSRVAYDLLKLQYLYSAKRINAAALAVPTAELAMSLGSNVANADRTSKELKLFDRVITVPLILLAFE